MSAFGPKRTSLIAPHMSAFGGKADITIAACLLSRSLLGVKRTWVSALQMSAYDPKRTWPASRPTASRLLPKVGMMLALSLGVAK